MSNPKDLKQQKTPENLINKGYVSKLNGDHPPPDNMESKDKWTIFRKLTHIIISYEYLFWTTSVEMYFQTAENITSMCTSSGRKLTYVTP